MTDSVLSPARRTWLKGMSVLPVAACGVSGSLLSRLSQAADLSCTVAPAMTQGPYWLDKKLHRSDIRTDTTRSSVLNGLPFFVKIKVYNADGSSCSSDAVENVQIDIWHADAIGEYSGVSGNGQSDTSSENFLRGYQISNSEGAVNFTSIYPGWYTDRSVHVHLRARTYDSSGNSTYDFVTQLFFDESITDSVHANAPYASHGTRDTVNSTDMHYLGVTTPLMFTLTTNDDGSITGEIAIGLSGLPDSSQITALNNFSVSTSTEGDSSSLSVTSTLNINDSDVGSSGSIYVLADVGGNWFVCNGSSWVPYTAAMTNAFPAFYTGTLSSQHTLTILSNANVSPLGQIKLYVGYGSDTVDMLQKTQYQQTYSLG